ncbi:MAG: cardiolipin synthase [bacterium]|nr:cardiolipin synthase [bacterium]
MTEISWQAAVFFACEYAVRIFFAVLVLLRPSRRQALSPAWIVVILALPVGVGVAAYVMFGEVRFGRRRVRRHQEIVGLVRQHVRGTLPREPELEEHYRPIATLAQRVAETQPRPGNALELMGDTAGVIDSLVRDIDAAQNHCHLLYYIYLADESGRKVGDALRRAEERGVDCRVLVDAVGSHDFLDSDLRYELARAGVQVVPALPTRLRPITMGRIDLRNHRKIAVIDGLIGYSGSHNIADASFAPKPKVAPWVDATLRIEGPAVRDLQELFVEDWYLDNDESLEGLLTTAPPQVDGGFPVQVMGTGPNCQNEALVQVLQAVFHTAREEVIVTTPYFVPDEGTRAAMETAARRGVHCILVVPAHNDSILVAAASRSHYEPLLEAGVEIHEYQKGLLHAKTMTVDRDLALVSTANFDRRSFELNFEVSTLIYDTDFASRLRFLQRSYMEDSKRVDSARWTSRHWSKRIVQNAAGILGPLI